MDVRTEALLKDRQHRAVEALIVKIKNGLDKVRQHESEGDMRLARMLNLVEKAQKMSPSEDQIERMWRLISLAQSDLDAMVHSVRVRYVEGAEEELDGKEGGRGEG